MLIKRGDGQVLSVIKPSDLENVEEDEVEKIALEKLKTADAKHKNIKIATKEKKNV